MIPNSFLYFSPFFQLATLRKKELKKRESLVGSWFVQIAISTSKTTSPPKEREKRGLKSSYFCCQLIPEKKAAKKRRFYLDLLFGVGSGTSSGINWKIFVSECRYEQLSVSQPTSDSRGRAKYVIASMILLAKNSAEGVFGGMSVLVFEPEKRKTQEWKLRDAHTHIHNKKLVSLLRNSHKTRSLSRNFFFLQKLEEKSINTYIQTTNFSCGALRGPLWYPVVVII